MIVYSVHNRVTGKRYYGVTTMSLRDRWQAHLDRAKTGCATALYNAIRKYGREVFEVQPFASLVRGGTVNDLFGLERQVIAQECSRCPGGYNMTEGGEGAPLLPEVIERIAAAHRGRKLSAETRAKMSAAQKARGARHTPEARARIGAASKGRNVGRKCHWAGKQLTSEHRAKLAAAWTDERRASIGDLLRQANSGRSPPNKGKPWSEEQRKKVAALWTPERRARQAEMFAARRREMMEAA